MDIDYGFSYWGPLLVETKIDQEFLDILLEKGKESRDKNLDYRKNLAGVLRHEYYYDDVGDWYFSKMNPYINSYLEATEKYMGNSPYTNTPHPTDITRWDLIRLWINFQQAKEYNPPHDHSGDLSFVMYLQVPDELGIEYELQSLTISEISSVVFGKAIPKGKTGSKMSSPLA